MDESYFSAAYVRKSAFFSRSFRFQNVGYVRRRRIFKLIRYITRLCSASVAFTHFLTRVLNAHVLAKKTIGNNLKYLYYYYQKS